jgi:uncharacterized protein (DUF2141 family)
MQCHVFHRFRIPALLAFLAAIVFAPNCGQPIPPTGGPRDTLPPILRTAEPKDATVNFKGNRIVLEFDEYVSVENPLEKMSYSPVPKIAPQVEGRLKTVTIKLKDTLEPNTTYSIDFGNAIRDINENNELRDFRYVFSTGPRIDSGILQGRVIMAETGQPDSTLIVVLHTSMEDSAVAKQKPRYAARLNKEGDFVFRYLAPGEYAIYAIKDVDGAKKYDQQSEAIAFLDKRVQSDQTGPILLYAFVENPEEPKTPKIPTPAPGSVQKNKDDKRLRFTTNLENERQDLLDNLVFQFENKLADYDSTKLRFTDEAYAPAGNYTLSLDSTRKKLTVRHTWAEDRKYNLIIEKDFAKDTAGNFITRTDTLEFRAKKTSDYGSLDVRIIGLDTTARPILSLYKDDKPVLSQSLKADRYKFALIRPTEYEVRILYDRNGNGKWDTGHFGKRIQPERVVSRKQKLNIRANWDNELEINLQAIESEQ